ncbi:MAG: hypothetical protein IJ295_00540 [Clostridia bacterium]|nr:hypothetical protein [Clostridia bacterium]
MDKITNSNIDISEKVQLILQITDKKKALSESYKLMSEHPAFSNDFKDILIRIRFAVKNPNDELGFVEDKLQKMSNDIYDMELPENEKTLKSLCLCAIENLKHGLGTLQFTKENKYVTKASLDFEELKGYAKTNNLDTDKLYSSVFSNEFQDKNIPLLADFVFQDNRKINQIKERLKYKDGRFSYSPVNDKTIFGEKTNITPRKAVALSHQDFKDIEEVENPNDIVRPLPNKEASNYIDKIFDQCDKNDLFDILAQDWKTDIVDTKWTIAMKKLFNFVNDTLTQANNKSNELTDEENKSREIPVAAIHRVIDKLLDRASKYKEELAKESQNNQKGEEMGI